MAKTAEETIAERDERHKRVFNDSNPYGYDINVNNTVLGTWYKRYISKLDGKDGTEPSVRLRWERAVKALITKKYKEMYKLDLCEPIIGFTKQRVEELVVALGVDYNA